MIRRPPRSTRTDTLFPYTTLFRSLVGRKMGQSTGRLLRRFFHPVSAFLEQQAEDPEMADFVLPVMKAFARRSEEHTSELQSLMRISYAVFCLKKKKANRIESINEYDKTYNIINRSYKITIH